MFAIHHIKRVHAVESSVEDATYLTLKLEGRDLEGVTEVEIVLYFYSPEVGQIQALARAINGTALAAAPVKKIFVDEDDPPTTPSGRPYDRDDVYRLLRLSGHSATKALEIILDAKRGSEFAIHWIRSLRGMR